MSLSTGNVLYLVPEGFLFANFVLPYLWGKFGFSLIIKNLELLDIYFDLVLEFIIFLV